MKRNNLRISSLFLLCYLFITGTSVVAQDLFPEAGFLYSDQEVARIDITINQEYLDNILYGDPNSDDEYPASFKMTRGTEVKIADDIGFRLRGNTSRYSQKKSFKVSINSFTPGRTFQGVEKINLNGEHNDPSISRAKICWELFREMGVPAPRANHVELYINGVYRGLYINVEHIDEEFVDLRFGNNDGNLYKCLWPADLDYLGSNPDFYKIGGDDRRTYELKRNEELDDYSDLANFIDILNNTSPAEFPLNLEPVFNVNSYLKNLVVEIITGHWDAYSFNKNNYYLYNNEETGRFEFIPYDTDNTLGIDWFGPGWFDIDVSSRDIYNWGNPDEPRPLTKRILQNPLYRDRFSFYMNRFLNDSFNPEIMDQKVNDLRDKIASFTVNDTFRTKDYGYTYEDFYNSFDFATGNHVKKGIKSYIDSRHSSAANQVDPVNIAPIISFVHHNNPKINEDIIITALVEDEETPSTVSLYYSEGEDFINVQMQSTGGENYRAILSPLSSANTFSYYLEASDNLSQNTREPYSGYYYLNISTSAPLYQAGSLELSVYPNPFSSYVEVSVNGSYESVSYLITDITGKIIMNGNLYPGETRIYTANQGFSNGIYLIRMQLTNQNGVTNTEYRKLIYEE